MSFVAATGFILVTVVAMFALVFVLAGVEARMFDDVLVDAPDEATALAFESEVELPQAA